MSVKTRIKALERKGGGNKMDAWEWTLLKMGGMNPPGPRPPLNKDEEEMWKVVTDPSFLRPPPARVQAAIDAGEIVLPDGWRGDEPGGGGKRAKRPPMT